MSVSYDAETEQWFFSVIDVIEILTGSAIPKRYWSDLKGKLQKEGSQVYEKIVHLKMQASDGKNYETDCLNTQDLFTLIKLSRPLWLSIFYFITTLTFRKLAK